MNENQKHKLREALEATGHSLKDVTVFSDQNDPFRMDTPANHRDGQWLHDILAKLGITRKIHNRGIHYAILGQIKPDGLPYTTANSDWEWLEKVSKVARWLGYVDFEQITDERNLPPEIRIWRELNPQGEIDQGVSQPDIQDSIHPSPVLEDMYGKQPYHLVLIGEKSSLKPILSEIVDQFQTDLYLPTGEPSNTMLYHMAKSGVADPRPMRVFYISDCDPSGWQMPVSVAHKLQAFKVTHFPDLNFQVIRAGLTPQQVKDLQDLDLPVSELKDEELRAEDWERLMGVKQIEVDALVTLYPETLREMVVNAIKPFYDDTLDERVAEAKGEWLANAQEIIDQHVDQDALKEANERLETLKEHVESEIEEINAIEILDQEKVELPEIEMPEAEDNSDQVPEPLIDSNWHLESRIKRLIQSKRYKIPEDSGKPAEIQMQCLICGKEFWTKDPLDDTCSSLKCKFQALRQMREG